jgi:hypothetical protein
MSLNLRVGKSNSALVSSSVSSNNSNPQPPAPSPAIAPKNDVIISENMKQSSNKTPQRPTDFHRKGAMITSVERFRVITETLSSVSDILKDLKKNNYPMIKHRLENLKRKVAVEIRKEVPDFNPGNLIPVLSETSSSKSTSKSN